MAEVGLFAYGTLQPGYAAYAQLCADQVIAVEPAIVLGQLYKLPMGYPALILQGSQPVYGHRLRFANDTILSVLDDYEQHDPQVMADCFPGQDLAHLDYRRQPVEMLTPIGTLLDWAWAYVMSPAQVERLQGVLWPSGKW
jgi:gamma-glutamylcyclotransferase (GGCT)/AIG2-like uncharacterized protein YtfP